MKDSRAPGRRVGHRRGAGFSLIELMVVVAIIGIIAAVALPSYQNYVRESRRIDAHQALTTLAAQQERFFSNNNGYTADVTALGYAANPAASAGGYYQLSVVAGPTGVIATSYRVQATPVAGGPQAADATCSPIWQDSTGAFGPSNECWNR